MSAASVRQQAVRSPSRLTLGIVRLLFSQSLSLVFHQGQGEASDARAALSQLRHLRRPSCSG